MILKSLFGRSLLLLDDGAGGDNGGGGGGGGAMQDGGASSGLNADQKKVASALGKIASSQPQGGDPNGSGTKIVTQKVHKTIFRDPTEAELGREFKVDDDAPTDLKDGTEKVDEGANKKKDDATVVAKKDITAPVVEPAKATATKKDATTVDVKTKVEAPKQFDYTGYSAEETAILKQMSNAARDFTAKQMRELKEVREQKPALYYQHQEGYKLDPEFKQLESKISLARAEREHWRQQLINIKAGRNWTILQGFDKDGNPVVSAPMKASDEADVDVSNALQQTAAMESTFHQQHQGYGQQYQRQIGIDNGVLQAEREKRFEWIRDEKKMEDKVPIEGMGEVPIKKIREDFKGLFARYHHGNPILEMAADMFVALQIYGANIREMQGTTAHTQRLAEDLKGAEPSPETAGDGKGIGSKDFNMEGLPT